MPTSKMRTMAVFAGLGLAALLAAATIAEAQERGDAGKGLAYVQQNCAECHGVLENERVSPHFNVATFKRIAGTPGMTELALRVFLQTPHPNMPNLIVDEPDKSNVVAYIMSLKTP